jgi:hypothetical protein
VKQQLELLVRAERGPEALLQLGGQFMGSH